MVSKYNVALQTPIGTRQGHMTVSVQEHQICGTLDVLKQANPFSGTISETGECSICGELTSLFRSIPYQGTGNVTQEALCLLLRGKKESFVLSGRAGASALPEEREGTA